MKELDIPPAAFDDPESFEILRVWAAKNEQHVTINSGLNGGASDFGFLLAQLAIHGSKLYSERDKQSEEQTLKDIWSMFKKELFDNSGDPGGYIPE